MFAKEYRVKDVNEAIELAYEFRDSSRYNWFRGQRVSTWKPYSSLYRLNIKDETIWDKKYKDKISRLNKWVNDTKGLEDIAGNCDAIVAVAQHYGMPTNFLDFTLDPAVAGYFSADTLLEVDQSESCIYCLNIDELCAKLPELAEMCNGPETICIEPIRIDVPKLWRLKAQSGVFLFVPINWDHIYQMDKIVFPYTGYPAYPSKKDIYPERKSPLELVLDQFFDNENKIDGMKHLLEMISNSDADDILIQEVPGYVENYDNKLFKDGVTEHLSWSNIEKWLKISNDRYEDVNKTILEFTIDWGQSIEAIEKCFLKGLMFSFRKNENIRDHEITIKLNEPDGRADLQLLQNGFNRIWDGMRLLPYSNEQFAKSLSRWLRLYLLRFHENNYDTLIPILNTMHEDCIEIEFGSGDGSSSRAWVGKKEIYSSIRNDFINIVNPDYGLIINDIIQILLACYNPRVLFDFDKLVDIFAVQIIPTQIIRDDPIIFNPTRIMSLGLP